MRGVDAMAPSSDAPRAVRGGIQMRLLAFAIAVSTLACNMDGLPNGVGGGGPGPGTSGDGGASAKDGGLVDLAITPDFGKPLGGEGAMCASACDCQAGLACFQKQCT